MEIKVLKTFVAVATYRSFSGAARALHTVQPAVSRQISELENELGVKLFWRNTREVKLTSAGEALLVESNRLIALQQSATERVRRVAKGETGQLRIGYISSACSSFLPDLVRQYSLAHPNVQVSLFDLTVQGQQQAFENNDIDIALTRPILDDVQPIGLATELVYNDELVLVLPKDHHLANVPSIALNVMRDSRFIIFKREEAEGLYEQTLGAFQAAGVTPIISSQPRSMQTLLVEVGAGLGIGIAPHCIKRLVSNTCAFVKINDVSISIPLVAQFKHSPMSPTVSSFVTLLTEHNAEIQAKMSVA
ncbi:Hca operon transcriptional activator HcaR [Paraglaciecola mesophila]|uniref:Hca operon transcriptional activator HcaR n=1 Tax=Paraglaciecola mesophila TaxID=197222 RepID=A0A857JN69_9ALTE|nr:LysR family transcriptional regulator [Paraglaciecola mesophila]QHJ12397.1 Hca operon transcriptional activator HcaR [Paraglaciecola mesophila]